VRKATEKDFGGHVEDKNEAPASVYRRYLEAGKLGFQRCSGCGVAVFYPRVVCPACGGDALEWRESAGRGSVYATTAVHRRDAEAYNVCLVDLDEGFRMMSRIEGVPAEEVRIGLRVALRVARDDKGSVAVFVPEAE
jgi:uncharacterized OB-fold protein